MTETAAFDEKRRFGRVALPSAHEWGFTKWLYRPTLGWERVVRSAGASELAAAAAIRLNLEDVPALVPLETLPGRNHYEFPTSEDPPWRWRVSGRYSN